MAIRSTMRRILSGGIALGVAASLTACASGGSAGTRANPEAAAGSMASKEPARHANVLTADEIQRSQLTNAYDVISTLRPRWLQTRGVDSFTKPSEIQVYLGSTRMNGGINSLREIAALGITQLEFVDGIAASSRWGLDHASGAIVVSLSPKSTSP
jgi:hypothetical protein